MASKNNKINQIKVTMEDNINNNILLVSFRHSVDCR